MYFMTPLARSSTSASGSRPSWPRPLRARRRRRWSASAPCATPTSAARQVEPAERARHHPDGKRGGGTSRCAGDVRGQRQRRAGQRRQSSGGPALRVSRRAICGAVSATKATGPTAAVVDRHERDGEGDEPDPRALDAQAERVRRSRRRARARAARGPPGRRQQQREQIASGMKSSQCGR